MKTQVHLYVKNENLWTRFSAGSCGIINIFRKLPLDIVIDGNKQRYKPQNEAYVIDLAPGTHVIEGKDPRASSKKRGKAVMSAMLGASAMAAGGGSALAGAMLGANSTSSNVTQSGMCSVDLKDGDIIKISCQANGKGAVIFKLLQ